MSIIQLIHWVFVVIVAIAFTLVVLRRGIDVQKGMKFCFVFGSFLFLWGFLHTIVSENTQPLLNVLSLKIFIIEAKTVFAGYGFILAGAMLALIGLLSKKITPDEPNTKS